MRGVYVKEGPTVFLRRVFVMEIFAGLIFLGLSYLGNYEMLYLGMGLDAILRYDLFIMIVFSLFQLFYLLTIFVNWYFSYFEIRDGEILKKSGIIFHKKQIFSLLGVHSVSTEHSPIDRLIGHASIVLEGQNGPILKMRNIPNYREYVDLIKRSLGQNHNGLHQDLRRLLEEGENSRVEFKETLRFDTKTGVVNKEIERAVLKSIAGFMNADGGTLIVGVKDDGLPAGLSADFATLPRKDRDGFENHLFSLVRATLGVNVAKLVAIRFEKLSGQDLAVLEIKGAHRPVFLKINDKEEFFLRAGNSTRSLSMSETEEYIRTRFV